MVLAGPDGILTGLQHSPRLTQRLRTQYGKIVVWTVAEATQVVQRDINHAVFVLQRRGFDVYPPNPNVNTNIVSTQRHPTSALETLDTDGLKF